MSEMRHYKGKLKLLLRHHRESLEDQICEVIGSSKDALVKGRWKTFREQLMETSYEEYVIYRDRLYAVEGLEEQYPDEDMYRADSAGIDFNFEVRFYDGVQSLDEALEEALKLAEV